MLEDRIASCSTSTAHSSTRAAPELRRGVWRSTSSTAFRRTSVEFTDAGMTDPDVGRTTFEAVLNRKPERGELSRLFERRLHYLHATVEESEHYRVLPGAEELLLKLIEEGYLLGLVTGNLEAAAHIKLHRAHFNRFFSFGGYGSDSNDRAELTRVALKRASLVFGEPVYRRPGDRGRRHPSRRRGRACRRDRLCGGRQPSLHC